MSNARQLDLIAKIVSDLYKQPQANFDIMVRDGEFSVAYEFGKETPDSPMMAAASYGIGDTLDEALQQVVDECRL